jgi:hypothetical protein
MTDDTDALRERIVAYARERRANMTPRIAARDRFQSAAYAFGKEHTLHDRVVYAARRLDLEGVQVAMNRQTQLCVKDELTEDDFDEMLAVRVQITDHPVTTPFDVLVEANVDPDEMPAWYADYLQETAWGWLWWANYFGKTLEKYAQSLNAESIAVIRQSSPYPEGWKPRERRNS